MTTPAMAAGGTGDADDGGGASMDQVAVEAVRGPSIMPLVWQLVGILVAIAIVLVWLAMGNLSATERATLAPEALWGYTLEHLKLTIVAAVIVLVIAIPLGILLTRGAARRFSGPVMAVANIGQAAPAIGLVVLLA